MTCEAVRTRDFEWSLSEHEDIEIMALRCSALGSDCLCASVHSDQVRTRPPVFRIVIEMTQIGPSQVALIKGNL